jgi:copper chaperone NosL
MNGHDLPTLYRPLDRTTRIIQVLLIIPLLASFAAPLWRVSMTAPQYPDGLYMDIYSYKLDGGNGGQDINEINELNHYIGMQKIERAAFTDLDWIPFALGVLALLALRVAAIGNLYSLIDLTVLSIYVSVFSLFRFAYREYLFGHNLDPHAAVRIQPFTPAILGTKQVANFTTNALPQFGSLLVGLFVVGVTILAARQFLASRARQFTAKHLLGVRQAT